MSVISSADPFLRQRLQTTGNCLPGLGVCALLALIAWTLGDYLPLIGAPVLAILLGLLVGNIFTLDTSTAAGVQFGTRHLLQWAIIGLGLKLDVAQLWAVGSHSLTVTLVTLSVAFVSALLLGRWLKLSTPLTLLIGAGTAICGGAAIAAIAPILRPKERELMLALTTIFLFNLVAVLLFPALGHWLNLSDAGFGLWAGTAINDTSSVVAAAYSYSQQAGDTATIVKLTRASLILPVCLVLALYMRYQHQQEHQPEHQPKKLRWHAIFPWFILGFVLAAGAHSAALLPSALEAQLSTLANFLLVMALAAVGLSSRLDQLRQAGFKPVLLGLCVWVLVASTSLGVQWWQGSW